MHRRLLFLSLFICAPVAAHIYPMSAVDATLKIEPGRVVTQLEVDSIYWIEEVLQENPLPPTDWSKNLKLRAQNYINSHWILKADGQVLMGELLDASYQQRPWEVYEQGRIKYRIVYPDIKGKNTLTIESHFYEEYLQELIEEHESIHPNMTFKTNVSIPGFTPFKFVLSPASPSTSVSIEKARRTGLSIRLESFVLGFSSLLNTAILWPLLTALIFSFGNSMWTKKNTAFVIVLPILSTFLPFSISAAWAWFLTIAACLASGRWFGEKMFPWVEAVSVLSCFHFCQNTIQTWLPGTSPGILDKMISAFGLILGCAIFLFAGHFLILQFKRQLFKQSETHAEELYHQRRKLVTTALALVCVYGLIQNIAR